MYQLRRIQEALGRARLGALILTDDRNIYYATGFMPTDSAAFITPQRAWLITDSRYTEDAAEKCGPGVEVLLNNAQHPLTERLSGLCAGVEGDIGAEAGKLSHLGFLSPNLLLKFLSVHQLDFQVQQILMNLRQFLRSLLPAGRELFFRPIQGGSIDIYGHLGKQLTLPLLQCSLLFASCQALLVSLLLSSIQSFFCGIEFCLGGSLLREGCKRGVVESAAHRTGLILFQGLGQDARLGIQKGPVLPVVGQLRLISPLLGLMVGLLGRAHRLLGIQTAVQQFVQITQVTLLFLRLGLKME